MTGPEVAISGLTVRAGAALILDDLALSLPPRTMVALMGPMGSGKSTLLKVVAQRCDRGLSVRWDRADYRGAALSERCHPSYIPQKIREAAATPALSRRLRDARIGEIVGMPGDVLCIDEPTHGLAAEDGAAVMAALRARAERASVLVVTHNQAEARRHCTHVALCAGGRLVEYTAAADFFGEGAGPLARQFLATGGLPLLSPGAPETHKDPAHRAMPGGYDLGAAGPAPDRLAWILEARLCLRMLGRDIPLLPHTSALDARQRIVSVLPDAVVVWGPAGPQAHIPWPEAARPPDGPVDAPLAVCRHLEALLAGGHRVLIAPDANLAGAGALVGAFLVTRGFGPDRALEIAERKLPQLHFGLRMEQFLWDVDLAWSIREPAAPGPGSMAGSPA